ncbi:MAG: VWA domain-containing protein [Xanthomonadales bacterium]|nr:VWA domain-containing protein [Xanthomonadales bacterium]
MTFSKPSLATVATVMTLVLASGLILSLILPNVGGKLPDAGRTPIADRLEAVSPETAAVNQPVPAGDMLLMRHKGADPSSSVPYAEIGRDRFEAFDPNPVKLVSEDPVSTFSVDVDTASYSFVRRMLNTGVLPQIDAVRIEEMINYFSYDYPLPQSRQQPFLPTIAMSDSPWASGRKLLHIGIKGFDVEPAEKPRSNLVFLLDVSGSMNNPDKLPLVKQSMEMLLSELDPDDTVAIAVYAGAAGTVLEPTPVSERRRILDAMRQLQAGGSTAGAQGIRLAYELAESNLDSAAVNRVILATDGDFNVGITNDRELQSFIERKREQGIYLSVLGFGQGNYQDARMQTLAQNGNGVAAYIDTLAEAQKVLVDEATSTLFPIATDVKIQVEFNPARVAEYRLIGYETRQLRREDFNNDAVDAGDIGAGHTVTAIYEITPVGSDARQIEPSRYQPETASTPHDASAEYAFLKIRYKLPGEEQSELITRPITNGDEISLDSGSTLAREAGFATAVAAFAQLLKGGEHMNAYGFDEVIGLAQQSKGDDNYGYRTEFIQLVRRAKTADAIRAR